MQKIKRICRSIIKLTVYLIFVSISIIVIYNFQIFPHASHMIRNETENKINYTVSSAIGNAARELNITYSDFVTITTDNNGRPVTLSVNSINANNLRTYLLCEAMKELKPLEKHTVNIPLGTVIGGELTSGKGPNVDVTLLVTDALQCDIETEFYEVGINQTLHSIKLTLTVKCSVLLPTRSFSFNVVTDCLLGETVLMGEVPEAYTRISRLTDSISEEEIDDIFDFGASAAN